MSTDAKIIGGIIVGTILILATGVFFLTKQETKPNVPEDQIVSKNGLHWHPKLSIVVKGQQQEISKDIGIGAVHQELHTHDTSGTIHMEMKGLITKDETRLKNFFQIWGKIFSKECIFDSCNGGEGTVKMFVNGRENGEFENYQMRDGDNIEVRYE